MIYKMISYIYILIKTEIINDLINQYYNLKNKWYQNKYILLIFYLLLLKY